jgi:hypothetical protein
MEQPQLAAESPQLVECQPDVRQPDAGDSATDEIIPGDHGDQRVMVYEEILVPERDPGKDKKEHAHLEAEHDVQDGQQTAHMRGRAASGRAADIAGTTR